MVLIFSIYVLKLYPLLIHFNKILNYWIIKKKKTPKNTHTKINSPYVLLLTLFYICLIMKSIIKKKNLDMSINVLKHFFNTLVFFVCCVKWSIQRISDNKTMQHKKSKPSVSSLCRYYSGILDLAQQDLRMVKNCREKF